MSDRNCRKELSYRTDTIFEESKLSFITWKYLLDYYTSNELKTIIAKNCGINKNSLTLCYQKIDKEISEYAQEEQQHQQFGIVSQLQNPNLKIPQNAQYHEINVPVEEIDESLFSHHNNQQIWILGLYDRGTQKAKLFYIQNKSAQIIIPIIQQNVAIGSRIYTDGWPAYNQLQNDYDHRVINHQHSFGFGLETTNHIENLWSILKKDRVKFKNLNVQQLMEKIQSILYFKEHRDDLKRAMYNAIRFKYNIN